MGIKSHTYTNGSDINIWLSDSSNAPLLHKWHTPVIKYPRISYQDYDTKFTAFDGTPVLYGFAAANTYWNSRNAVYFYPSESVPDKPSSAQYPEDVFGIENGGVYYEGDGIDCDIISIKSVTAGDRFSILAQEGLKTVICAKTGNNTILYLYTDEARYNPSGLPAYITAKKALGNGVADKYIAQPIVINGLKTPLYSIVSNTASADPDLFTEVVVGGQRFFVVDYGVGVRI